MGKPKTRENLLTQKEIFLIIKVADTLEEKLLIWGLLYTGMRISEFVHLRKDWIRWESNLISIPKNMPCKCSECKKILKYRKTGNIKKSAGIWMPKTIAGARTIVIAEEIKPLFKVYFDSFNAVMDTIPNRINAWQIVKRISIRAGLGKKVFPHAIRGTFATLLAGMRFTPSEMKDIMGWSSIASSDDYIKLSGEVIKEAFKKKWRGYGNE